MKTETAKPVLYSYQCPVCKYYSDQWTEPLSDIRLSHDICPCCGIQFGYTDFSKSHEELGWEWIADGAHWRSRVIPAPEGWDGVKQYTTLYMSERDFKAFIEACEDDTAQPNAALRAAAARYKAKHS